MSATKPLILVLGGRRSGKSAFAERCAQDLAASGLYVATCGAYDDEMRDRIRVHQQERGSFWTTQEEELDLVGILATETEPSRVVLIECLTLFLSNQMMRERDIEGETKRLVAALKNASGPVVLVANEVGLGIIPDNALARKFADHAGRLNQALGEIADTVVFVAAGLPLALKGKLP